MVKHLFKFIFCGFTITLALTGCNLFGGSTTNSSSNGYSSNDSSSSSENPDIVYTASDLLYATKKDEMMVKISNSSYTRNFYKKYSGYCAVGFVNISGYFGPIVVAEDSVQTAFYTDYDQKTVIGTNTVEVNGKT